MNPKKLEEMGRIYFGSDRYDYSGEFSGFKENFEAGVKSALNLPEVKALVEAAEKYLSKSPVDGWHFSDCDASEDNYDEEMPCSCGVGAAEIALKEALADLEGVVNGN